MTVIDFAQYLEPNDEAALPTEDEVVQQEALGWYQSQKIILHALLEEVRQAILARQLGKRDHALPRTAKFSDWRPEDGDGVRNNEFCSLQNDTVRKLVMMPLLGTIAAKLARSPAIRLFDDQSAYKPPAGNGNAVAVVGWLTDPEIFPRIWPTPAASIPHG